MKSWKERGREVVKQVAVQGKENGWDGDTKYKGGLFGGYSASSWDTDPKRTTLGSNRAASYGYYNPLGWLARIVVTIVICVPLWGLIWLLWSLLN